MRVFGVNNRGAEAARAWVETEDLPFPVLQDPEQSIAVAFGLSNPDDDQYLANPAEGRRPAVIIDEQGQIVSILPDLSTVEQQKEALAALE